MSALTLDIPLAKPLPSLANWRGHWRALADLKKKQRHRTALYFRTAGAKWLRKWLRAGDSVRISCTLTRISGRTLDAHDNLRSAFKSVVDQIADELALTSDRSPRIDWHYAQERGAPGYRIQLEVLEATS